MRAAVSDVNTYFDPGESTPPRVQRMNAANTKSAAKFYSRSHQAVTRVYDDAGNVIEAHEHKGDFKEW